MLGDTPVKNYPDSHHQLCYFSASDIITFLRAETIRVRAARLGFAPEDTGTHSLRFGGAMAMHIVGVPYHTLMGIGRWHLLVFMVYIQQQISSFSASILVRTSQ